MAADPVSADRAPAGHVPASRVCLGVMVGAHGVRGLVKVKSFTEVPEDVAAYGPVSDRTGARRWSLQLAGRGKGVVLVRVEGVKDRDAAQALHGTELYVERAKLPALKEQETFYYADLIGLRVEDRDGRRLGFVRAVENYGAGDFIEVEVPSDKTGGKSLLLAFTKAAVPQVDIAGGRLIVEVPEELEVPPAADGAEGRDSDV
ncbi:MAG: ribosome maturation factor RimM [Kiloniellaceae bacterium]